MTSASDVPLQTPIEMDKSVDNAILPISPLPPSCPSPQPEPSMEVAVAQAMDELTDDEKPGHVLVKFHAASSGGKGRKNPRFGKNPDGTVAKKADKTPIERKSPWGRYLFQYKVDHPELYGLEATIEARKHYVPTGKKPKSFERIFTEVWKTKNPNWQKFSKEERLAAIRASFVATI